MTRRERVSLAAAGAAAVLAAGCGGGGGQARSDAAQPPGDARAARAIERTWGGFRRALAARDGEAICRLMSARLANQEGGLEEATCAAGVERSTVYKQAFGPLTEVRVRPGAGAAAAEYRRPGQPRPLTVQFVLEGGRWKVNQLFRRYGY